MLTLYKYLGAFALAFGIGWFVQGWRMDAQLNELKATHATEISVSLAKAQEETNRLQRIKDEALERANALAQVNAAAADSARNELGRLRQQIATERRKLDTASRQSLTNYTATLQTVFGECSAEVERLAKAADGHALDARTLKEAWGK